MIGKRARVSVLAACIVLLAVLSMLFTLDLNAGVRWKENGIGLRVMTGSNAYDPQIVEDGEGGAISVWRDFRSNKWNIYAQRIDEEGKELWRKNGESIRVAPNNNADDPQIVSDGAGGAIIVWKDFRHSRWDIYVQRIDADGKVQWIQEGVGIRTELPGNAEKARLVSDGAGGAIIAWSDSRSGKRDIYAQRINNAGRTLWGSNGMGIRTTPLNDARNPQLTSDGEGGAVIVWEDNRNNKSDIYAQRVDSEGNVVFEENGVAVRHASPEDANNPQLTSDGHGGAIVAWEDARGFEIIVDEERLHVSRVDIYAQKIRGTDGMAVWSPEGVNLREEANLIDELRTSGENPQMVSDGHGGAIVVWEDWRTGDRNINAARVGDRAGDESETKWTRTIRDVQGSNAWKPQIARPYGGKNGGAIVTWMDKCSGERCSNNYDIYAQSINIYGVLLWEEMLPEDEVEGQQFGPPTGIRVRSEVSGDAKWPQLARDGLGGAFIVWQDDRSSGTSIYAQRVSNPPPKPLIIIPNAGTNDGYVQITNLSFEWAFDFDYRFGKTVGNPEVRLKRENRPDIFAEDVRIMPDYIMVNNRYFHTIQCRFDLTGEQAGCWDVSITNPDGQEGVLKDGFEIEWPSPPALQWFLSEGSTGVDTPGSFETWVLVQNAGNSLANVSLTYMTSKGPVKGPEIQLQPQTRATVNVAGTIPDEWEVSTRVISDVPVVAARTMYWNSNTTFRQTSLDALGVTEPAYEWFIAEGTTGADARGSFETWVLVQNPGDYSAEVKLTFMTPEGSVSGPVVTMPPKTRKTFNVSDTVPNEWSVSTKVESDMPVVAERSVYWSAADTFRQAGHGSSGVSSPSGIWYLAEGSTGSDARGTFETWVLIQNPNNEEAAVNITYMTPEGDIRGPNLTLPPNSRQSVSIEDTESLSNAWSVSTRIESDIPVIAERAMYWHLPNVYRQSAHASIGVKNHALVWLMPEGSTGSQDIGGFETWVLIQNPNDIPASIEVDYMTEDGLKEGPRIQVQPRTRITINAADTVPNEWSVSTRVTSLDIPVIAERCSYWSTPTVLRQSSNDSIGYPKP